jgi:copper oxidase (laccase) domain-containing protein
MIGRHRHHKTDRHPDRTRGRRQVHKKAHLLDRSIYHRQVHRTRILQVHKNLERSLATPGLQLPKAKIWQRTRKD